MAERRHWPVLQYAYAAVTLRPIGQTAEAEFRPPAQPARDWRKADLERAARTGFGADVIDQDDLAAGPDHARELVERRFGIRHRRDHKLRDHDIE